MLEFLASNWLWILLAGGMLFMHLGHGGHGGHGGQGQGGCGGHRHSSDSEDAATDEPAHMHQHNQPTGRPTDR